MHAGPGVKQISPAQKKGVYDVEKNQKWTDEELAILAKNYPVMGAKGCVNATFSCLLQQSPERILSGLVL